MLRISQLKLPVTHTRKELEQEIIKKAGGRIPKQWQIIRRSVDARKKPELFYIYTIDAAFPNEKKLLQHKKSGWTKTGNTTYRFPYFFPSALDKDMPDKSGLSQYNNTAKTFSSGRQLSEEKRPVIVGAGPAGLFAGLILARQGFRPLIFERGDPVHIRSEKVRHFWEHAVLDPESNVQFGEGGAGTFSDGKLNTLVKDKLGRNHFVLQEFVRHGAPEDILYEAKPHIGTDILKNVVAGLRKEITDLGGEVHFQTKVTDLYTSKDPSKSGNPGTAEEYLTGLKLLQAGQEMEWACENVILAIGHSARDTFLMLHDRKVPMSAKAFAIGVRVEHPREMINESQYGKGYPDLLPAASYKLTHQCRNGRGIYSFCMCPGGYVVNSSSEPERLCVNGMSYHGRDAKNSNSAIITTVGPEDFSGEGPLAGLEFQRRYEALAYQAGSGKIPVQLLGDFRNDCISTGFGAYRPATKGTWQLANLRHCLPDYICDSLMEGMTAFGRKIQGYDREDTILLGVETRTSSPVRIERNEYSESRIKGLFPCGEGAGYAGGITSAAMDGLKVAEQVAKKIVEM